MTSAFFITFLAYVVTGALPPLAGSYLLRVRFLGGPGMAVLVGIIAAVIGGVAGTLFLPRLPDIFVIAGAVDVVVPFVASLIITTLFGLVSSSNSV